VEEIMNTTIQEFNVKAAFAASHFASKDTDRPILTAVAVYSNDLMVATNSFILGMVSTLGETPFQVIERVQAADKLARGGNGPLLVDGAEIAKYAKATAKASRFLPTTLTAEDHFITLSNTETTQRHVAIEGAFPAVGQLTRSETPIGVAGVGLNPTFLAALDKAGSVCGAGKWGKDNRNGTPVVFWGGIDTLKPVYWSMASIDMPTIVMLQMPVRLKHECWGTPVAAAVAA
jgi:hypothetical protein